MVAQRPHDEDPASDVDRRERGVVLEKVLIYLPITPGRLSTGQAGANVPASLGVWQQPPRLPVWAPGERIGSQPMQPLERLQD